MLASGIYRITNTVNGKVYIGSSKNTERRMREHRRLLRQGRHHSAHLQAAWALDGEGAFVFDTIIVCAEDHMLLYEQRAIDAYEALVSDFGYNKAPVAGSTRGFKHSPETIEAFSKARAGRKRSPEWVANMSASRKGKARDPEAAEKAAAANRGKKRSPEVRAAISRQRSGMKMSAEVRQAMSESRKGRTHSEEAIRKIKENGGRPPSILVLIDGEQLTVAQACQKLNIGKSTMLYRIHAGKVATVRT